jgi:glycosyltransferase involved in cell wall biosynthesis
MQTPIRVALLADSPLNSLKKGASGRASGGTTWLPQIAVQFSKRREFEFYWISFDPSLSSAKREVFDGITYMRYPKIPWQIDDLAGLVPSRFVLNGALRQITPHVIHAWGSERTYASVLARTTTTPGIFSFQGLLRRYQEVGGLPRSTRLRITHPSWRLAAWRERRFTKSATIVTAESEWAISLIRQYYTPNDTRVVEYGVHPDFYSVQWEPKKSEPNFVFVGSLSELKGIPTLIEAVRSCETSGWRLYLVGDGPLKNWILDQRLEQVECLGLLGWDALQDKLSKAWALVHPTKADTSPNSVKEARVVGLPIITTKEGGQAGYVHNGENGIIVPVSDSNSLARAMDLLASDFDSVKRLGITHHSRDREYLRPEKTADTFCNLYLELARRATNQPSMQPTE